MLNCRSIKSFAKGSFGDKKAKAFSLIEMSLVLAIMGTIAGLSLPMLLEYKGTQKRQSSIRNIDLVLSATGTFAATNHIIPCPASKTSKGESVVCTATSSLFATGYVPYKALGLRKAASKDGFGNPLRYAIDPQLSVYASFYSNTEKAALQVTDQNRKSVFNPQDNHQDKVALVVLSEGKAFGSAKGAFELENTAESLSFVDAAYSTNKEAPFRHIVRWSTRNNLLTYYGKSSPLPQARSPLRDDKSGTSAPQTHPPKGPTNPLGGGSNGAF